MKTMLTEHQVKLLVRAVYEWCQANSSRTEDVEELEGIEFHEEDDDVRIRTALVTALVAKLGGGPIIISRGEVEAVEDVAFRYVVVGDEHLVLETWNVKEHSEGI